MTLKEVSIQDEPMDANIKGSGLTANGVHDRERKNNLIKTQTRSNQ